MFVADTQLTASEVLRAFHHDEPFLFLGAAFGTVGLVAIAFCVLRHRFDALMVWLAIFSFLYGQRLWMQSELLGMSVPPGSLLNLLRAVSNFLVPVPAFLYFHSAGLLGRRGKTIAGIVTILFLGLVVAALAGAPLSLLHTINNILVIIALLGLALRSLLNRHADRDYVIFRRGLICFVLFAIWDNTAGDHWRSPSMEPYGFAIFLACLGYVTARRTLERDQQLGEIQKELDVARKIQLSILPAAFPASTAFSVAAKYVPMTAVAGDLYEFLVADDYRAGLLIADVSGHGVPAALIASMVKMAATSLRVHAAHPAKLLTEMNAALCGSTQGQFVTAAYVHLDAETRELRYAAAGHPSMLLLRDGAVMEVSENGLLLAATDSAVYKESAMPLKEGDRLLLYTDGLLEARNTHGALFGEQSLSAVLKRTASMTPADAANSIVAEVQQWAKSQDDDLTLLVCDFRGASRTVLTAAKVPA
jgi:sigma-B regulation protein RsbU (phosphoserine phosphatase)